MDKDKRIIIDDVDVSKCQYFYKDDPCKNTCQHFCTPCEWVQIQNCMYKYGKRKEQECEELNNTITNLENIRDEFSVKLDQLKAELEQETALKETYLACYKAKHDDIKGIFFKYKQTLTEIKEIAEDQKDVLESMRIDIAEQILQKISEVLDENI